MQWPQGGRTRPRSDTTCIGSMEQANNYSKLTVVVITILNQHLNVFGSETCQSIPRNACPYQISEHTGELVQFVAKYLTRDHPEYHARVREEVRDKVNLYCAHPDCHPNPCQNGGTCEEEYVGYSCTCPGGYHGVNCEIRYCSSNPCQNGGTCKDAYVGYSCTCLGGYLGMKCEIALCPANWVYATTKCFLVVDPSNKISFPIAYDYCNGLDAVAMGNGMMEDPSLVFIESNEEHDVLKPLITAIWLWLNCERTGESFVCYNDRGRTMISHYRNWGVDEPTNGDNEDCISFKGEVHPDKKFIVLDAVF
ncbi:protein crumbs-like [Lytechinus pictus]|uniref:protein crumbs-like n=1 Tax=Lytechinus pictus TaxID=7653 RepID=UPI0030B9EF9F